MEEAILFDRITRGAEASAWLPVAHWTRARVRVLEGIGTDLTVRVRGQRGEKARFGEPLACVLDELEPGEEVVELDLAGVEALQVVPDIRSGARRLVRVAVEQLTGESS